MKILVTGANGMLGQDLCPILEQNAYSVIKTDRDNLDITKLEDVESVLTSENPAFVIHCAAYTAVDKAETEVELAYLINEKGSENLAIVSGKLGIPIVCVSTDYVFDGTKVGAYVPTDKTNPQSVYGASKLAGEIAIQKNNPKHYIARTSWLYGIFGNNFVETMIKLSQTNPELKVVNDQVGCPTWTVALSNAIVSLIKENKPFGIYHTCGSGNTSWHGFAEEIFRLSNINIKVNPCSTEEFPRPAKRPMNSIMENNGICPDWKESLSNYIKLRSAK